MQRPKLSEPIEVGKFFKNRKGDIVVVQLKEYEGVAFCDVRQFFTDDNGITRPTKRGVAVGFTASPTSPTSSIRRSSALGRSA
jgi:hypothetical protein